MKATQGSCAMCSCRVVPLSTWPHGVWMSLLKACSLNKLPRLGSRLLCSWPVAQGSWTGFLEAAPGPTEAEGHDRAAVCPSRTLLTGAAGSLLLDWYGWPSVFYFSGGLTLLWACYVYRYLLSEKGNRGQTGQGREFSCLGSSRGLVPLTLLQPLNVCRAAPAQRDPRAAALPVWERTL